jgi:hypothetical protein
MTRPDYLEGLLMVLTYRRIILNFVTELDRANIIAIDVSTL